MHSEQNGLCAICGQPEVQNRCLAVDHDHVTGVVRGLLCYQCNVKLGYFENKNLIEKLFRYVTTE